MEKYTISEAYEAVKTGIEGYLLKNEDGSYVLDEKDRLPFFLEGSPGIGKTQIVNEIAKDMGIGFVSYSLTHHTRNTLLGLPVIETMDDGRKYTRYTVSEILERVMEMVQEGFNEGILLLDEFPCMAESVAPVMLSFLQNKNIGEYRLPEGWTIVLCGNPREFNKSVRSFDAATLDRVRKIEIGYSTVDFVNYARSRGLHPAVADFIEIYPEYLFKYSRSIEDPELVTARGWENLSKAIDVYERMGKTPEEKMIFQFIKSETIAKRFKEFLEEYTNGYSTALFDRILMAKDTGKDQDAFSKMGVRKQWQLVDFLYRYMEAEWEKSNGSEKALEDHAIRAGNLVGFVFRCKAKDSVIMRTFKLIQNNKKLINALVKYPQKDYIKLCKRIYEGGAA